MKNKDYPGIFLRVKAAFIDSVILIVSLLAASDVFSNMENPNSTYKAITFFVIFACYEPILVSFWGATIGHRFCKIEVQRIDNGKRLNIITAIIRFVIKYLLGWVSLFTISTSKHKQAIHDSIVSSVVVSVD